jgi:hypothetical protein
LELANALGYPIREHARDRSRGEGLRQREGKAFVYAGREEGSFAVASPLQEKEVLIETDPDTFWESDHYRGWPAVLVRFGGPEPRERTAARVAAPARTAAGEAGFVSEVRN